MFTHSKAHSQKSAHHARLPFFSKGSDNQSSALFFGQASSPPAIQKKCAGCEAEEEVTLQAKATPDHTPIVGVTTRSKIQSLKDDGQPLSPSTRAFFETRFGSDLSQVRVHTDSKAAETARSINAKAFTVGRDIVFGAGQHQPHTTEGKRLLAHELVHVGQQNGGSRVRLKRAQAPFSHRENPLSTRPISNGEVLPEPLQQRAQHSIQSSFDFSKVRIHHDETRAKQHNALAYTIGNDVVVGNGMESLYSQKGLSLIGHELAHVVQQSRGGSETTTPLPGNPIEKAADRTGHAFATGQASHVQGTARTGIARTPRSLSGSLLPGALSDTELETEIQEIRNWLLLNESSSEQSNILEQALAALETEAGSRTSSSSTPTTPAPTPTSSPAAITPAFGMQSLAPPGNCIQGEHDAMQRLVKAWCDHPSGRTCTPTESCPRIQQKIRRNQLCAQHRRTINNLCYNGGDVGHQIAERDARRAQATCMAQYRLRCEQRPPPVPVPEPVRAPRRVPEVDRGFMDRMAEITGLTGAALIAYIIISEGSRLFPPRNLVPVP